jgi:hypothetical protein
LKRLLAVCAVLVSTLAVAQDQQPAGSEATEAPPSGAAPTGAPPAGPAGEAPPLIGGFRPGIIASVSDLPFVAPGLQLDGGYFVSLGLGATYDGNGLAGPAGPTDKKFGGNIVLYAAKMVKNTFPFAHGPEVLASLPFGATSFLDVVVVQPGYGMYYAPFNAPILIGTGFGVRTTFIKGAKPRMDLTTNGVRFLFGF